MGAPVTVLQPFMADHVRHAIREVNYELHLVQHGMRRFAERHPVFGLPLSLIVLVLAWSLYWPIYGTLLALLLFTICCRPLERWHRKRGAGQ